MRVITVVSILFLLSAASSAQQPTAGPATRNLAATISGKDNPDRIPDLVAWRMLFLVLADGPNGVAYSRRAAHLRDSGLTPVEIGQYIVAANVVARRLADVERKVKEASDSIDDKTSTLRTYRDRILQEEIGSLEDRVAFPSTLKMRAFLRNRVKSKIQMTAEE